MSRGFDPRGKKVENTIISIIIEEVASMAKINEEMKQVLNGVMWVFATVDEQGEPNAVPIHYKKVLGEQKLMLVDNFMNKSKANVLANPRVSVSVWQNSVGFQFKGKASYFTTGSLFDEAVALIPPGKMPKGCPKGVVIVDVDAIYTTSPGAHAGEKID